MLNASEVVAELTREYSVTTELHAHTKPISGCSNITPENMAETYAKAGVKNLLITNHLYGPWRKGNSVCKAEEYLSGYYNTKECCAKLGVNAILGVEIRFTENTNDYLVYGVAPEDIEKMIYYLDKGIVRFYRDFKNDRNLILQAHPFRKNMELAPLYAIDGIESFNLHFSHNSAIGIAARFARDNGLIVSGGSDFHDVGADSLCLMRTKSEIVDSYDVADALKSRDYLFDISGSIVFPYGY